MYYFSVLLVDKRELKVFSVFCFVRLNTVCNHALSNFLQRKKRKEELFPLILFILSFSRLFFSTLISLARLKNLVNMGQ